MMNGVVLRKRIAGEEVPPPPSPPAAPASAPNNPVFSSMPFEEAFKSWLAGWQKLSDEYHAKHFPAVPKPVFSWSRGPRYMKVRAGGSVRAFVDRGNGDVLKAASWRAPAAHARGNIFDQWNGLKYMGPYGPRYLK